MDSNNFAFKIFRKWIFVNMKPVKKLASCANAVMVLGRESQSVKYFLWSFLADPQTMGGWWHGVICATVDVNPQACARICKDCTWRRQAGLPTFAGPRSYLEVLEVVSTSPKMRFTYFNACLFFADYARFFVFILPHIVFLHFLHTCMPQCSHLRGDVSFSMF